MKHFITYFLLFITLSAKAQCPDMLDYSGYKVVFSDDFNYYPLSFKTDSTFLSKWEIQGNDPCTHWGRERYSPSQVSIPSEGIIRLTAIKDLNPVCQPTNMHISGLLASKKPYYVNTGIIEARIKLPPQQPTVNLSAWPAFWILWGKDWHGGDDKQYTEIDIFDNKAGSTNGIQTNIFFKHLWYKGSPTESDAKFTSLDKTCHPIVDLSDDYHTYSCLWTPSRVSYYVDGIYITHFDFDRETEKVNTFPDFQNLIITLQTNDSTISGLKMDIDWVRYLTLDDNHDDFIISRGRINKNIMTYPYLPPDFNKTPQFNILKYKKITIHYPADIPIQPYENKATILESGCTTILPDFIADQSAAKATKSPNLDVKDFPMPLNGYFEIRTPNVY